MATEETALVNFKNYYIYADMIRNMQNGMVVNVPTDITKNNVYDHIDAIKAILMDGIETEYIQTLKITVSWGNGVDCKLFIVDYWYNLWMWSMILANDDKVEPKHIFWSKELKRNNIKNYVDKYILTKENKIKFGNKALNENLYNGLWNFASIEKFSYFLANTINNEDDIALMMTHPDFFNLTHHDFSNVPFDQRKEAGMDLTNQVVDILKNSKDYIGYDHGLANSLRASEAINIRQYKEVRVDLGIKPNGSGGIYPYSIDKSFMNGGVNDPLSYFIESSTARAAQIMSKTNVGDSGDFARLLGLNNTDTILNLNAEYECMSQHYIKFEIKTKKHLNMIKSRYYRLSTRGIDRLVDDSDESLIGKTVYLHSPMTCASNSSGNGICKRCYGDLYWTNMDINVGKIAAELLSSQLTQTLLSAKHLLEVKISQIVWNPEFFDWFDLDINSIRLTEDIEETPDIRKYMVVIDPASVELVNDEDDTISVDEEGNEIEIIDAEESYNEYITYFYIKSPTGEMIKFESQSQDPLYLSVELNSIIRSRATNDDGMVNIPITNLIGMNLFYIKINNNEISKIMNDIINVINKSSVTEKFTKDEALQTIVDLIVDGNLTIDAVHLEVILSNQVVDPKDILRKPNWNDPHAQYRMFTLNQALTNNPSVVISLLYKDLHRVLYNPLTFSKNAPSFFDLFFCEQPQVYMSDDLLIDKAPIRHPDKGIDMVKIVDKKD